MMERGSWKSSAEICPACPRCGSANTKFCYYNNYSLTQPRYFCKGCRRYWTKGGSLRNVPVGGGCRKSRRGKSATIRVSTFHNPTTNSSSSISTAPDKYASSSTSSTGTIDIAAVYANFLTQPPNQITHETTLPNDQLPDGVLNIPPPLEFPSFQGLHMNDYHGFFECGPFGGTRLIMSEPPLLGGGSSIFYGGGVEGLDIHQKPGINNGSFSINNGMENGGMLSSLPPLPGEDVAAAASSEGMLWPDSDVMLPAMDERPRAVVGPPGGEMMNSELLSGNVSPFSALNLEAIFRS